MTTNTAKTPFVVTRLGITAWIEANRVDFSIEGPGRKKASCSAFYNAPNAELILDGKSLVIGGIITDEESGEPAKLEIELDGQTIRLGRRTEAAGSVSFYRSLDSGQNTPRTKDEILNALSVFEKRTPAEAPKKRRSRAKVRPPVIDPNVPFHGDADIPFGR